ncbi:hypothetical protein BDZ89DRAFT_1068249 [Hymenopellis radicata]|nr:hypothetical protein BDZ89DRAFT_1068249 [Hymenopellis radicata]
MNCIGIRGTLHRLDPWFFPSEEEYNELLKSESFDPSEVTLVPDMSDEEAESIMDEVHEICKVDCRDSQGNWAMMYMRLRFSAVLRI